MTTHRCIQCHKHFNPTSPSDDEDHRWCVMQLLKAGLTDSYDKWVIECLKYSNKSRKPRVIRVKKSALSTSTTQETRSPSSG